MVRSEVLRRIPDTGLRVYFVWIPMVAGDSLDAARRAAALVDDPRAAHFWDGDRHLGRALGARLGLPADPPSSGATGIAWDVYLVYGTDERWWFGDPPPAPRAWMHQLDAVPAATAPLLDGPALRAAVAAALAAPRP